MPTDQLILLCSTVFLLVALAIAAWYSIQRGREALAFRELAICEANAIRAAHEVELKRERSKQVDHLFEQFVPAIGQIIAGLVADRQRQQAEANENKGAS
jgi:hypothetical protein